MMILKSMLKWDLSRKSWIYDFISFKSSKTLKIHLCWLTLNLEFIKRSYEKIKNPQDYSISNSDYVISIYKAHMKWLYCDLWILSLCQNSHLGFKMSLDYIALIYFFPKRNLNNVFKSKLLFKKKVWQNVIFTNQKFKTYFQWK